MRALIAALCLLTMVNSWAAIGTVSEVKGTSCSIERNKQKVDGLKGAGVESNDTYVTGSCVSNITFKDDTKVKVTENSRLLIDDFVFDPKASDAGKLALKVGMGTVRYASGQIAKNNPQSVNIKTPTAAIAVRGTDFTMTVDEAGQSLVVLLPSCKDDKDVKQYELEEQRCKVGKIEVSTGAGTVTLDKAFEATFVLSATMMPTAPAVLNTIEGKIGNNMILVKPMEIVKAVKDSTGKSKKEEQDAEIEDEESRRLANMTAQSQAAVDQARLMLLMKSSGVGACDPHKSVCVAWEQPQQEIQGRGKGIAYRITDNEHYAEVKTLGYVSNTFVSITQNDNYASTVIGDGSPGGNIVNIKQNTGTVRIKP